MAGDDGTRFEIPAEMRALAEKSVEQAKQAFDIFISAAQHAVNAAETHAVNAQAGAKEIGELAIGFTERNITSSFVFAQKLLQAKEPKDVVALHTDYVNSAGTSRSGARKVCFYCAMQYFLLQCIKNWITSILFSPSRGKYTQRRWHATARADYRG